jgi:hypothetical protein
MYTNIATHHALDEIGNYLRSSPLPAEETVNVDALIAALRIVMTHNVFRFGDTFWVQLSGTAMGAPPAPMYATLYFAIHESRIIPDFPELHFYRRYIDDGFGIWIPNPTTSSTVDLQRWESFKTKFGNYGQLTWEFTDRCRSIDYLDLTLSFTPTGRINTSLYEKALNLYLYLPSHSAHPPGVLKGLIRGAFVRIQRLTSDPNLRLDQFRRLYIRLRARGYTPEQLQPHFESASISHHTSDLASTRQAEQVPPLYFHVQFHPCDPPSQEVQRLFRQHMLTPPNEPPLPTLVNHSGSLLGINRLVIAYHRPRNLGNLLAPRRLRADGSPVSQFLQDLSTAAPKT